MTSRGKDPAPSWELLFLAVLCAAMLGIAPPGARSTPVLFTSETQIVSQQLLTGVCLDSSGAERADLTEWSSSSGACDKIVCHVEPSGNYTVTHECRQTEPSENPDTTNCVWVTNTTASFPDCCPQLDCSQASALTTIDPLTCYDLASSFACTTWQNATNNCTDTLIDVYNYTQVYCRNTCGLC